jgi:hypothetical protein
LFRLSMLTYVCAALAVAGSLVFVIALPASRHMGFCDSLSGMCGYYYPVAVWNMFIYPGELLFVAGALAGVFLAVRNAVRRDRIALAVHTLAVTGVLATIYTGFIFPNALITLPNNAIQDGFPFPWTFQTGLNCIDGVCMINVSNAAVVSTLYLLDVIFYMIVGYVAYLIIVKTGMARLTTGPDSQLIIVE